ncbi:hypothetical protein CSAL01_03496 [Colletotrichum salicis]|uniref:Uncharacterized protein n=1 Tax=Colletotrichum salicis TaxID=1209931 RepID=A0A135T511_9PEZI|nr:hypothetical protein CSAL01_03496 [Colletotrichum salicis]
MFYTNDDDRLLVLSINNAISSGYEEDSIKNSNFATGSNSSMAAYWPWITYQGPDNSLFEVQNALVEDDLRPSTTWDARKLNIVAAKASRLALVPLSSNFSVIATKEAYGIIYQAANNSLMVATPGNSLDELAANCALSWTSGSTAPTISKSGSFARLLPGSTIRRITTSRRVHPVPRRIIRHQRSSKQCVRLATDTAGFFESRRFGFRHRVSDNGNDTY